MGSSKAGKILREIEKIAETRFLPIIGSQRGQILVSVILRINPKFILEIGSLVGYSAILMGKELGSKAHLTTIEIDIDKAKTAIENIKKAEIPPTVEVLTGDAKDILPTLDGTFDLVFIDADKSEYFIYLQLVEKKIHKGSVVVADNTGIFADQLKDYLDYVRDSGKYISRFIPVGRDGVEVSDKL